MKDDKDYYVIIPRSVLEDEELTDSEKILYAEIAGLCQQSGYCFASSRYFANRHKCTTRTIRRWINHLKDQRYINVTVKDGCKREITIPGLGHSFPTSRTQPSAVADTNDLPTPDTDVHNNNKDSNNKANSKENISVSCKFGKGTCEKVVQSAPPKPQRSRKPRDSTDIPDIRGTASLEHTRAVRARLIYRVDHKELK